MADNVAILTQSWDDGHRWWWNQGPPAGSGDRVTINAEILTGVGAGVDCTLDALCGDSVLSGLRFLEVGSSPEKMVINGSVVIGHHSHFVHAAYPSGRQESAIGGAEVLRVPSSTLLFFDHNLNRLDKQPPGTEALGIQSIRAWDRD